LVVDDEEAVCWTLKKALEAEKHKVAVASSAEEAFVEAQKRRPDAIILDVRLPGLDGLTAIARLRQISDEAPIIVVTAFGNLTTAVRAVEGGAFDYLAKPFDLSQALATIARALQRKPAIEEEPATEALTEGEQFVGRSAAIQAVFKRIALVAAHDAC